MRLNRAQLETILSSVLEFIGEDSEVRVFGSRLDDARRGGDLDLLLISHTRIPLLVRAELKQALESRLHLPVDILNYSRDTKPTPFQAIALTESRPLGVEHAA
jgi:predicted nucleotidyltransferase